MAMVAPIGIFLGRLANFVNAELYGRVTNVSWGVIFPGSDGLPRHPSQLYEALLEGMLLFFIMHLNQRVLLKKGIASGVFLIFYSIFRIFAEYFREPDVQLGFLFGSCTMGQLLSLPMLLVGVILFIPNFQRRNKG
jgi:phosphatidylglycerol:prolipoprotein diacylglycerol transferase